MYTVNLRRCFIFMHPFECLCIFFTSSLFIFHYKLNRLLSNLMHRHIYKSDQHLCVIIRFNKILCRYIFFHIEYQRVCLYINAPVIYHIHQKKCGSSYDNHCNGPF